MPGHAPAPASTLLVVCLCAEWCGVCREYTARFKAVQAKFPQAHYLWIDVEDEADLLHPLDVENFPTLLLAVGNEPRFFGPIPPQPEMLERLIRAQIDDASAPALANPAVAALVSRIRAEHQI
jgi:thioredoxin 1